MRKNKILFILGRFYPTMGANTINTLNIIEKMIERGYEITCISVGQDKPVPKGLFENLEIYSIKNTKYGRLLQLLREGEINFIQGMCLKFLFYMRKIKNLFNLFKFPDVNPSQSKDTFKLAQKLHKEREFDCVIGVFRPFSGVAATIFMKEKYPELLCGAYYLDLIFGSTKPKFAPDKLYKNLCYKGEIKAFKRLDFILMAKGGKPVYSSDKYINVNSRIRYVDFPVFVSNDGKYDLKYNSKKINIVYAGTLDKGYRNPIYFLKMIKEISNEIGDIVIHIYGKGNCKSIIENFAGDCNYQINDYGMVPHEHALSALQQADFVINISNKTQNIVPSKIFELFSTGKPILNFVSNKGDTSQIYFNKYPSVYTIQEWKNIKEHSNNLKKFILKEKGKCYSIAKIQESFVENTPEFTVEIIEEYLNKYRGQFNAYERKT